MERMTVWTPLEKRAGNTLDFIMIPDSTQTEAQLVGARVGIDAE
jgi:hypothetical protein